MFALYVRPFASYMLEHIVTSMLKLYYLIMKDDCFADENVGWTCLPSTPEQTERFKFDVNIISIISYYVSRIMTKTVFRVYDQI